TTTMTTSRRTATTRTMYAFLNSLLFEIYLRYLPWLQASMTSYTENEGEESHRGRHASSDGGAAEGGEDSEDDDLFVAVNNASTDETGTSDSSDETSG